MGTNFYGRIIPTKERRKELSELILNSDDWDKIKEEITQTYAKFEIDYNGNPIGGEVHLGKRSGGWKFLWNPNIYIIRHGHSIKEEVEPNVWKYHWIQEPDTYYKVYPLTKKGITDFVMREDVQVIDEYGEIQNKEGFLDEAFNWTTWGDKEAFDGKTYEEEQIAKGEPSSYLPKSNSEYNNALRACGFDVEWPYTDFYSDGLRFSTSNEFS